MLGVDLTALVPFLPLAAAAIRQANTPADYLAAREYLLEALHAALNVDARFWGF